MASVQLIGNLLDPGSEFSIGDKVEFQHVSTTGQTLKGFVSRYTLEPPDAAYDWEIQYGNVLIRSWDVLTGCWTIHGVTTINQDTPNPTTLPAILNAMVPPTDDQLLIFQALVADAEAAAAEAETQADRAESEADRAEAAADLLEGTEPTIYWDVDIPFNDGISIDKGYGDSGKEVTFSRASETGNINKSGVVETIAVDEPAIASDGLSVYESVTNELMWSEDFSQSWTINQLSITPDAANSPNPAELADEITDIDGGNRHARQTLLISGDCTLSAFLKKGSQGSVAGIRLALTGGTARFGVVYYNFDTKQVDTSGTVSDGFSVKEINDGWVFISLTISNIGSNTKADCRIAPGNYQSSNAGDSCYAWGAQLTQTPFLAPYIKTEATPVTRAPDIASIPMMNNMPAPGRPFTIALDFEFSSSSSLLFEGSVDRYIGAFVSVSGAITLRWSGGQGGIGIGNQPLVNGQRYRFTVSYDGATLMFYIDGIKAPNDQLPTIVTLSPSLNIGANGGSSQQLNSEIKNFRIIHRALTSQEIAALGGPK